MKNLLIFLVLIPQFIFSQTDTICEPFLKGIVDIFPNVRDLSLSNDGKEAYFSAQSYQGELSVIMRVSKKEGRWTAPEMAVFSSKYHDLEPFLSPDNLRLYFSSNRALSEGEDKPKDYDIWYVERTNKNEEWSKPKNMGTPVNSEFNEFYPAVAKNGNLYFTCDLPNAIGKDDIFICEWNNGNYSEPRTLGGSINTRGYEFNAYISPDESMLIFGGYNREDGYGSGDLYVSYKNKDGNWALAKNMGKSINSTKMDYCPFVDLKTNTLYFTSKRGALSYPKTGFKTVNELLETMRQYENGQSRLYKIEYKGVGK